MLGKSFQKCLRMERLEEKVPLAGDVTVAVVNGDLLITGDVQANSLIVEEGSPDGHQYRIIGRDLTTVNGGLPNEWYFVDGVTRDVIVNLGDDADTFRAYGTPGVSGFEKPFAVGRDLRINTGAGEDRISLGVTEAEEITSVFSFSQSPVSVGRDLIINSGADADNFLFSATVVSRNLTISDSGGDTHLEVFPTFLYPQFPFPMAVDGNVTVTTGGGSDFIALDEITIGGNVTYGLGGGDDVGIIQNFSAGGSVLVNLGSGLNLAQISSAPIGGGVLVTGTGVNDVQLDLLDVASAIVVTTNSGDDLIYILNSTAGSAVITSGGGADYVQFTDAAFDLLMVSLGSGSDTLNLDGVQATLAVLLGGGGTDTLQEAADNQFLLALDLGFEVFETIPEV